ncbi:restriction endonuclease subunit S [Stutzerimonas nitrititolerans]|uniref:Restriction endonuclease subunit S n=1 Tax=Stutzerimonas nitrititolerans TaxID=2482751 RepID=A0ABX9V6U6_9GAMM|nr:restriction endonuclease subunit S [Stutzerimonas nitrititolerans]RMI01735.1 restriction endonuclease subunit S [Stutzerimonas nitrititolerans]
MSSVSFLEKLLDGVAVKWIEVGELVAPQRGRRLVKSQLEEVGSYAVYQNSMKPLGYYHESNAQAGATFVIVAGAAGEIGFSDVAFWAADDVYFFPEENTVNNKYLYHFLLMKQHEISSQVRRASIPRLSIAAVEKLEIPIPSPDNPKKSLEIQTEIARILDAFTELNAKLTTELTAELSARKKQYNYYRDQLLSFEDEEVEWKTLGSITTSIASGRNKARTAEGTVPVYGSTGLIGFTSDAAYSGDVVLVARVGANAGRVNAVSGDFDVSDNTLIIRPIDAWNLRFAFHQLTHMNLNQYAVGGGQPLVTGSLLKSLQVPLPSLKEQERIAGILDKFDALINSISESLPREIELRQKQYEHYRDLLLSFSQPETAEA